MATFDSDPSPSGAEPAADRSAELAPKGSQLADGSGKGPAPASGEVAGDVTQAGQAAPQDDLLAAVTSISSEAMSNIDHTLDQLTSSTDLFDVPAFDLDA